MTQIVSFDVVFSTKYCCVANVRLPSTDRLHDGAESPKVSVCQELVNLWTHQVD